MDYGMDQGIRVILNTRSNFALIYFATRNVRNGVKKNRKKSD